MSVNVEQLRQRQRGIKAPPRERVPQPVDSRHRSPAGPQPVIIRSTQEEVAAGTMMVQRIKYTDSPPVVGNVAGVGDTFRAHPFWFTDYSMYALLAHGPEDPIRADAYPLWALRAGADWVLMVPMLFLGSVVDPELPPSGCSG